MQRQKVRFGSEADVGAAHGPGGGDVIRRPARGKSGFRFSLPHYLLRDPLGDYLLESGMKGLLLQPGRDEEGLRSPGSHRVTG